MSYAVELEKDHYLVEPEEVYIQNEAFTSLDGFYNKYYYDNGNYVHFASGFSNVALSTSFATVLTYENGYFVGADGTKYTILLTTNGEHRLIPVLDFEYTDITPVYQNPVFYIVIAVFILIFVIICIIIYKKIYKKRLIDKEGSTSEEDENSNKW